MKKFFFISILFLLSFLSIFPIESRYSFEIWNRYISIFEYKDSLIFKKNQLYVPRGYFSIEPVFTENIKGRLTLDFVSSKDGDEGALVRLKYAYIDFSNLFFKKNSINFGLVKNFFGFLYDYDYPVIETEFADKEKVKSSADYGLSLNGYFFRDLFFYALSITNGEGYKKTDTQVDLNPAFLFNMRFYPFKDLFVGGSIDYENKGLIHTDTLNADSIKVSYVALLKYRQKFLTLWFEHLSQKIDNIKSKGISGILVLNFYKINDFPFEIVLRNDLWDEDIETNYDVYNRTIVGTSFNKFKEHNIFIQLNFDRTFFEDGIKAPLNSISFQIKWRFDNILKL